MDIGIIGYGVVGKVVCAAFEERAQLHVYDPAYQNIEKFENSIPAIWEKSEFIFVCVPTPQRIALGAYGGPFDGTAVDDCMEKLAAQEKDATKIVILTSTTLPSRVAQYRKKWPRLHLVVCPEFLTERTALEDYLKPKFRILGGLEKNVKQVEKLFSEFSACQPCPVAFCDAVGASLIKYMTNTFFAIKLSAFNQFYELWKKSGSTMEWGPLMEMLHLDKRLGTEHYRIPGPDGDRGWGGKCFPKDVNALLFEAEAAGVSLSILREAWEYNLTIREKMDWMDPSENSEPD